MRIDLHVHTTASDGTDTPVQLVGAAVAAGVDVLGITDHDTTGGWVQALASRPAGLTIVPGAEFSCVHHDAAGQRVSLHLLGYLFDPDDPALRAERARLRASRVTRAREMVGRLAADGYPITWAQVTAVAGGAAIGRPHIGRALVASGIVTDVSTAFTELLSSRGRYYVGKADADVFDAIGLVRAAGGLPVFAHPRARRRGPVVGDEVIAAMAAAGLVGLEVDHPDHDAADRDHAAGLARELDLIGTGSSDYHGTNKSTPLGACTTDPEAYARLLALPSSRRPVGS
ncbi:MAG: PHP domain-containing protein [Jatrophihabitantaceae bacterium]